MPISGRETTKSQGTVVVKRCSEDKNQAAIRGQKAGEKWMDGMEGYKKAQISEIPDGGGGWPRRCVVI